VDFPHILGTEPRRARRRRDRGEDRPAFRGVIDCGDWNGIARELAGFDPVRLRDVIRWPLREALLAYERLLRLEAQEAYDAELLRFAILAPWSKDAKPPKVPPILRGAQP